MKLSFEGKVVLITGSSTGIGNAFARGFAESGAKVVVNYNNSSEQALALVNSIREQGGEAIAIQADVSDSEGVDTLFEGALSTYGKLDILVNNAGALIQRCSIEEMTEELWERIFAVNTKSVFLCSRKVIPIMKKQGGGKIINISSQAARNGGGGGSIAYASSKGAVSTFTKGLAKELAPFGILVNGIAPGVIATPFHDRYTPEVLREQMLKGIPLGREGTPEECVGAVLFLASSSADYITGEMIEVNGGTLMD
jgi:3-oxoacyl-[acyl-carrier protein] reductase